MIRPTLCKAHTPVELEAVRANDAVRRRDAGLWRGHVVVEPAVLVVCDDHERVVPCRASADRLVHVFHQLLTRTDGAVGVLTVGGALRRTANARQEAAVMVQPGSTRLASRTLLFVLIRGSMKV